MFGMITDGDAFSLVVFAFAATIVANPAVVVTWAAFGPTYIVDTATVVNNFTANGFTAGTNSAGVRGNGRFSAWIWQCL
jgi:hypothetical protein